MNPESSLSFHKSLSSKTQSANGGPKKDKVLISGGDFPRERAGKASKVGREEQERFGVVEVEPARLTISSKMFRAARRSSGEPHKVPSSRTTH